MVFASSRPAPGMGGKPNFYLWQVSREGNGWSTPRFLAALNRQDHYHSWPAFGPDGRQHFRRTTPDWRTSTTLVAALDDSEGSSPVEDDVVARCRASRSDLRIAGGVPGPSGEVYFLDVAIPARDGAAAHADIWQCARTPSGWGPPTPLPADINTAAFETFPFFSPDGRDLFFVRGFRTFHRVRLSEVLRSQ